MKKLVLASLFLAVSQMTMAVNWFENPSNPQNPQKLFIDLDSVQKHQFSNSRDYYITAWVKVIHPNNRVAYNGQVYNTLSIFSYFDCKNRKMADEIFLGYYGNNRNVVSYEKYNINKNSSENWTKVAPNTMGEALFHMGCDAYEIGTKYGYQF